jgi:hypothetical protein
MSSFHAVGLDSAHRGRLADEFLYRLPDGRQAPGADPRGRQALRVGHAQTVADPPAARPRVLSPCAGGQPARRSGRLVLGRALEQPLGRALEQPGDERLRDSWPSPARPGRVGFASLSCGPGWNTRSGLAAAITRWPSAASGLITRSHLADSAKARWTRTIVGRIEILSGGRTSVTVAVLVLPSPPRKALVLARGKRSQSPSASVIVQTKEAEVRAGEGRRLRSSAACLAWRSV